MKGTAVAAALAGDSSVETSFSTDAMRKDLGMMQEEALARGVTRPVVFQALDVASRAGLGSKDCAYALAFRASALDGGK